MILFVENKPHMYYLHCNMHRKFIQGNKRNYYQYLLLLHNIRLLLYNTFLMFECFFIMSMYYF